MPMYWEMVLEALDLPHLAGFIAAGLVFSTFCMKTMLPLRTVAVASNIAFLAYSIPLQMWPIAILHGALLPLNILRLLQIREMIRKLQVARNGHFDITALLPLMKRELHPSGHVLFRKGDKAEKAFYLASGRIKLPDVGVTLDEGVIFGEMGLFMPDKSRMSDAVCATEAELYSFDAKGIVTAFTQEPGFAVHLISLVSSRLTHNMDKLRESHGPSQGNVSSGSRHMSPVSAPQTD